MKQIILLIAYLQLLFFTTSAQEDIVKTQGITSPIHQSNIGRIIFTQANTNGNSLAEKDFLDSYMLTNKSNLFMHVFMGNSVTNYMHRLAPALSADSLVRIGNYQFNFFIDKQLI